MKTYPARLKKKDIRKKKIRSYTYSYIFVCHYKILAFLFSLLKNQITSYFKDLHIKIKGKSKILP